MAGEASGSDASDPGVARTLGSRQSRARGLTGTARCVLIVYPAGGAYADEDPEVG
jgi:hypothetical protein